MDLLELKGRIYKMCIEKQNEILDSSKAAMDDAQKAANEYGAPKDRYDSFRTQLLRKRDLYAEQYEKALKELGHLQKLNPEISNKKIDVNALIITNKQKLYVAIGLGKVETPEGDFYVISPLAPLFQALRNKKQGDNITFNGQNIEVISIA
jgi:hypothetical protein